jgi:KaiC/GvpD/RAD55 family RecA-like ATPase
VPPPYQEAEAPEAGAVAAPVPQGTPGAAAPVGFSILTALELCEKPDRETSAELLGPLVIRSARTVVVGDVGEGKTSLVLQWVRAIVEAGDFLDWRGQCETRALLIDLEQGEKSAKRALRDAGLDQSEAVDYLLRPDGLALDQDEAEMAALTETIAAGGYGVVVLDPYYKAHRVDDPNTERSVTDLMRKLDALRATYGFALILPAHPRKEPSKSNGPRKLTIHDVAGSGVVVRGAEVVVGIERVAHGYGRLRFLKDRDGNLPIGEAWRLIFERGEGFRRDPRDLEPERDLRSELLTLGADGAWRTLKEWKAPRDKGGIGAGEGAVEAVLAELVEDEAFEFEIGPDSRYQTAKCWRKALPT